MATSGTDTTASTTTAPRPQRRAAPSPEPSGKHRHMVLTLIAKVVVLGTVVGVAVALTPTLVGNHSWVLLGFVWAIAVVVVLVYGTERAIPAKYLVPGTLVLVLFTIVPIVKTFDTSFTNYGDGTRTDKSATIRSIVDSSVVQTPDAPRYNMTVGTKGSITSGPFTLFLVNQSDQKVYAGTSSGLKTLDSSSVTVTDNFVRGAPGYTLLTPVQVNAANKAISAVAVPTKGGAIRSLGINQAFEGKTTLVYDAKADTITDTSTKDVYRVVRVGDREHFQDSAGKRVSDQSWTSNVGFLNYKSALTDSTIRNNFIKIFIWTVAFAFLSVATTFLLGLAFAVTLNDPRVKGQRIYRVLLILPYAMPGFIALLVWAGFFNQDFGLVNSWTHLDVNWFGNPTTAKFAVLLTNLWMGTPYMFLVATGALQAIPGDLKEAATIDGASGFGGFRHVTFPLLFVGVAPLLVSSFAFNFNNFNAVYLLTKGGPFPADNPTAGGTDILISYTQRLAFGSQGAQIGFASAISVLLFVITGILAFFQFRATRGLEEVN